MIFFDLRASSKAVARNDLTTPLYSPGASISATVFSPNHPPKKARR